MTIKVQKKHALSSSDGGYKFLRNTDEFLSDYTLSKSTLLEF